MAFQREKNNYCTVSITVKVSDKEKLYDLINRAEEEFTCPAAFVRAAINDKLEKMGIDFRLI